MIGQLSLREKRLAAAVALIFFVAGNYLMLDAYLGQRSRLQSESAAKTKQLRLMRSLLDGESFWQQRAEWIQQEQPALESGDAAGVELLGQVRELVRKNAVTMENPVLKPAAAQPGYTAVALELETRSAWLPLVNFLYELQGPNRFIALENANLKVDSADPTQLRGRFKIARWYAPQK